MSPNKRPDSPVSKTIIPRVPGLLVDFSQLLYIRKLMNNLMDGCLQWDTRAFALSFEIPSSNFAVDRHIFREPQISWMPVKCFQLLSGIARGRDSLVKVCVSPGSQ
ncbi:hypothetical protein CC2G_013852 [Coprinopsis cinerea AmutBmut pab1-1]|nr:hypothetical protein CC2G_013852 [Coprinopsis cinerea AmutBmut pab1-1]